MGGLCNLVACVEGLGPTLLGPRGDDATARELVRALLVVIGVVLIRHLNLTVALVGPVIGITWIVQGWRRWWPRFPAGRGAAAGGLSFARLIRCCRRKGPGDWQPTCP